MSVNRKFDRRQVLKAGGALAAVGLGAGSAAAQARTITIGTFSGAGNDVVSQVAAPAFMRANSGVEVRLTARAAAEAYPRLLVSRNAPTENGGMWNDTFAALGAKNDLFVPFDPQNVPTLANIPEGLRPSHGLGVPCAVQPYGIAYNPELVEKPKSWLDLFNPRYAGKVAMHENFWDQYIMLARILGKDEYNLSVAIDEWAKHKRNIGVWTNSYTRAEELIDKGEMWLAPQWGGFTAAAQRRGLKIAFAWPEEGCTQQTILACVNKGSAPEVVQLTQRFVDYWLQPEFQLALTERLGFSPSNSTVQIPAELANIEGIINPARQNGPLVQYDFAHVGSNLAQIRREIDQKLR